jgi:hypothetical protein
MGTYTFTLRLSAKKSTSAQYSGQAALGRDSHNRLVLGFDIWMSEVRLTSQWQDALPAVRAIAICHGVWQSTWGLTSLVGWTTVLPHRTARWAGRRPELLAMARQYVLEHGWRR